MITLSWPLLLLLIAVAAAIGALAGAVVGQRRQFERERELIQLRERLASEAERDTDHRALLAQAEQRLAATFGDLAAQSLTANNAQFLALAEQNLALRQEQAKNELEAREKAVQDLVAPIRAALEKAEQQIGTIEKERNTAFASIRQELQSLTSGQQLLSTETRNLVNALRRPEVRGQWGELTLRRVAELAGMVEHCDFVEQKTVDTADGPVRPDMIVRLPDRGELVVDVKTPLDGYIEAMAASSDQARGNALQRHARNVADRVRELSSKAYWAQFPRSPEFVILFIPGDQFLSAALSENPSLLEEALRNKVIITTPSSLVALLRAIAYGWRQRSLEENAEEIKRLGQELYERLTPFTNHLARLGRNLESTVRAFNESVGSLERKVLPGARRLSELGIRGRDKLADLEPVEALPRELPPAAEAAAVEPVAKTDEERPH
ncbi:MAG: DNA recombination protein RmuC [Gammaproteobacteria bacterium]|nr:DNA recombination protein RmuC [Gammaproteobacteria bacterium]